MKEKFWPLQESDLWLTSAGDDPWKPRDPFGTQIDTDREKYNRTMKCTQCMGRAGAMGCALIECSLLLHSGKGGRERGGQEPPGIFHGLSEVNSHIILFGDFE